MQLWQRMAAECLGTFWLVFGGCGSAVLAAAFPELGIGFVGVSLAFGLTVLTMAYTVGHISGCHLNPAVTVGLWAGGRFSARDIPAYVAAQLVGAVAAAFVLYIIASGKADWSLAANGLAANGYGEHSPGGFSLQSGLLIEIILTFFFLIVIMGSTDTRAPAGFAPIAIGLALTLIHLISIPVTNTSVNPARSTGPALVVGGWALQQLWLFWVAPLIGAALAGVVYRAVDRRPAERLQPRCVGFLDFLFDLPLWGLAIVLNAWLMGFALAALWVARRWIVPRLRLRYDDAYYAAPLVQSAMLLYSLVAALTAVGVWTRYSQVSDAVSGEATAIASLWRDLGGYPQPVRDATQNLLRSYTEQVIHGAWPQQRRRQVPHEGVEWMDRLQ